ncbi:MAG: hypothetical protein ABIP97_13785 [Chthoniobacterales bacterium]
MQKKHCFFKNQGIALLEVILAVAIAGTGIIAFAIALQKCVEASTVSYHELRMREAIESRLSEVKAEDLGSGRQSYRYFENEVIVEQEVKPYELRSSRNTSLKGIWKVSLTAKYAQAESLPLQTQALLYQP